MYIRKAKEPKEWTEYKCIPGVEFCGIPELQESLLHEQGYLCAYCERRIPVKDKISNENHRIEHWHCRDKYPNEIFDYKNLLICCPGHIGGAENHCDVSKENDVIDWSPLKGECTDSIKFGNDGTISSTNEIWNTELNEVLHLNIELLKRNRKETLIGIIECIKSKKNKGESWTLKDVKSQFIKWSSMHDDGSGRKVYYPYHSIVVYYLKKKIEMMTKGK